MKIMDNITYPANKLAVIDSLVLFSGLSSYEKKIIASRSELVEFKKGELIYSEGGPPDYFYCVVNGRVEIFHPSGRTRKRQETSIERVRRGDYFGSISSLTGQPHTVSARALNDSFVLRINSKNFDYILQKAPRLAVILSRSLSRRLSRKTHKEIFESTIVAVYSINSQMDSVKYVNELANSIKKESGKKVAVLKSASILKKNDVSPKLSSLTEGFHYVLVEISALDNIGHEILKQADMCHILSASDRGSLGKASGLIKNLQSSFTKTVKWAVSVIVNEDQFYKKTTFEDKTQILKKDIFASLPKSKPGYQNAIRRIAREISAVMVGLCLGSGGAMGFAHIGVLKVLEKEKIPVDIISGTSMGALVAALWASGISAKDIEDIACGFKSKLKTLSLMDFTIPTKGLIKGRSVRKVLKSYLGNKTFFDLKLPLKIVACDIKKRKEFIIDKGRVLDAVMASIAIPGIFEPVEYCGAQLVDGGIVNPLPVSVLSKSGIKRIIAVNTLPSPEDIVRTGERRLNIYDVIVSSFQAMEYTMAVTSASQADICLNPIPKLADWYEFYKADLFIAKGRLETRQNLKKIKNLSKRSA